MNLIDALRSIIFIGRDESCLLAKDGILISPIQIDEVKELGDSLGIRLFEDPGCTQLTTAGRVFAQEAEPILTELGQLAARCRRIQQGDSDSLVIQDLPFPLLYDKKIGAALYSYVRNGLLVNISLRSTDGIRTIEAVKSHHIDIGFFADPGDEAEVIAHLADLGIGALPLKREKFILRAGREHPLATKTPLSPIDLLDYPVVISTMESLDMMRDLLTKAYEKIGMVPPFVAADTNSYTEFYLMPLTDKVQIVDESTRMALQGAQEQAVLREFDDPDFGFTRYLIYDRTVENHIVSMFIDAVADAVDD